MIASEAASQHLEAILIRAALNDSEAIGKLPTAAIKGLRAIGQSTLPAIPNAGPESEVPSSAARTSKSAPGFAATPLFAQKAGQATSEPLSQQGPSRQQASQQA